MKRRTRLLIPLALIILGIYLQSGCIYIPTFDSVKRGRDVSKQVGGEGSRKPIAVGRATRDDVFRLLGDPHYANADRSQVAYTWDVRKAVWVWPLCFQAYDQDGIRSLVLRFNSDGVLQSFQVTKNYMSAIWTEVREPALPPGLHPTQPDEASQAATRPAAHR
jgi:outer membrane protein assembly factor BamE (lipoprotein component of BamABCDE complex)